jgi:hypothetical protein
MGVENDGEEKHEGTAAKVKRQGSVKKTAKGKIGRGKGN